MQPTDEDIIKDYLDGRPKAFELVTAWIRSHVDNRIWNTRVSGDDVASDTHEKLLMLFRDNAFKRESSLKTYVQRIALYTCVDALRRVKKIAEKPVDEKHPSPDGMNQHESIVRLEEQVLFERIISLLPAKCRQLWDLTHVQKLKGREIAAILGTSEGAIRTSLFHCKQKAILMRRKFG